MAELVQPKIAVKMFHPPLLTILGAQHYPCQSWPKAACIFITHINVPDALVNIIRAGSGAKLGGFTTNKLIPLLLLKVPHATGEQTSGDEIQQARGRDQEELDARSRATPILW